MRLYPAFQSEPWRTEVFASFGAVTLTIPDRRYPQFVEVDRITRVWELPSGSVTSGGRFSRLTLLGAG